jgi:hypothetical protein
LIPNYIFAKIRAASEKENFNGLKVYKRNIKMPYWAYGHMEAKYAYHISFSVHKPWVLRKLEKLQKEYVLVPNDKA